MPSNERSWMQAEEDKADTPHIVGGAVDEEEEEDDLDDDDDFDDDDYEVEVIYRR